ncbi:membrane dipeptidase [Streptomyces lydicus]|uniref:membrane dipeptidase n=1 Tax=Streptomyces lydicus TaxID=47763 RepID=UPI003788DA7D
MVCVNFVPDFLTDDQAKVSVDRVVDHIEHIVSVAGIDHAGLGSDFVREVMADVTPPAANRRTTRTPCSTSPNWRARQACPGHRRTGPPGPDRSGDPQDPRREHQAADERTHGLTPAAPDRCPADRTPGRAPRRVRFGTAVRIGRSRCDAATNPAPSTLPSVAVIPRRPRSSPDGGLTRAG